MNWFNDKLPKIGFSLPEDVSYKNEIETNTYIEFR